MSPEFLIAGYLTRDHIAGREQPGGSALYGSVTAKRLGLSAAIWTSAAKDFPPATLLDGIETAGVMAKATTTFSHAYDPISGVRSTTLEAAAPPLSVGDLPTEWHSAKTVMIAPNWTEVGPEAIDLFETRWVGLTPQGWFRLKDQNGKVSFGRSKWRSLPRKVALTVVSVSDVEGDSSAWEWITRHSDVAVRTMGKEGHLVASEGREQFCAPPHLSQDIDPTGAGDVFSAAMLVALSEGADPIEAARFGSAAASFAVERPGIEGIPTRAQIQVRTSLFKT